MKRHIIHVASGLLKHCLVFGLVLGSFASCAAAKRALVLGIDTYQPEGTTNSYPADCDTGRCVLRKFQNLAGAVNDAEAIADLLTSPKFGFAPANVALLTNPARASVRPGVQVLPANQTTRNGILAAMQRYLVDLPKKGDTVVFYAAGHGSLRVNSAGDKLTLRTAGNRVYVDSTLVPSDAYLGAFDVRDREMTRIFQAALDKGVILTVIFDSCHSGGIARGVGGPAERFMPYDPRPVNDPPDTLPNGQRRPPPSERKTNPALIFSAVQQDQGAKETEPGTSGREVHGAFTEALIASLQVLPANAPASEVYQAVRASIEGAGVIAEDPDLDAGPARRSRPLFGDAEASAKTGSVRAAAIGTEQDGGVLLDIGMVSGVGTGSEFTSTQQNTHGERTRLRVREGRGIARSASTVMGPAGAKVGVGELFELTKLVPAESNQLRFWLGPTNLENAEIRSAAEELNRSGITVVSDPVEDPYTDVLRWSGTEWILLHAGATSPSQETRLGQRLKAETLRKSVPADAKLWADFPVSREVAAALKLNNPSSGARSADTIGTAQYVLAGSLSNGAVSYAWMHKSVVAAGPRTAAVPDHSPGCSTTSSYPTRTDWVKAGQQINGKDAVTTLNADSLRLAGVHGWLQLANEQVAGTAQRTFYKLELVPSAGGQEDLSSTAMHEGTEMQLALRATAPVESPLWVYVLDIDCHGQGTLLYPRGFSENQYPGQGDDDPQVILRHSPLLKIGEPYGLDTLILLATPQPLPDPTVLDFDGVSSQASRGAMGPLEKLFANSSHGMRGATADREEAIPMGWAIEKQTLRTIPNRPEK